jgi:HK97 family phage portal protein
LSAYPSEYGHDDSLFSPEEYGDYLATSNEIYSAANLRARLISSLPLDLFRGSGQKKVRDETSPAAELLRYVNPFWTQKRLGRMDELSMCVWGESYWAIERDPRGRPSEIWWMKPSRVKPVIDAEQYVKHFIYEPIIGGEQLKFETNEIVWFRYPNPLDEFSALSPVVAARLAADSASAMMKSNQNLFVNGLQMGGLVVPKDKITFSETQAEELQLNLERRFKGVDKAHKWLVLRYEAELKGMNVSPKDAEFLGGLRMTLKQIGNAFGIPVPLLNDMEGATLTNAREYQQILWAHALKPDADLRAGEIEEQFLPLFRGGADHAAFDYSGVEALQEAKSESWARERQAIDVGRYTINEIREKNGEPPVKWGDVWWAPVNKFPVDSEDSAPPSSESKPEDSDPEAVKGEVVEDPTKEATKEVVAKDEAREFMSFFSLNGKKVNV